MFLGLFFEKLYTYLLIFYNLRLPKNGLLEVRKNKCELDRLFGMARLLGKSSNSKGLSSFSSNASSAKARLRFWSFKTKKKKKKN